MGIFDKVFGKKTAATATKAVTIAGTVATRVAPNATADAMKALKASPVGTLVTGLVDAAKSDLNTPGDVKAARIVAAAIPLIVAIPGAAGGAKALANALVREVYADRDEEALRASIAIVSAVAK